MNRKVRAVTNICFSLLLEAITMLSGLIVPRIIIQTYGSDLNGLVNSIASFIGYIALLQSGVGAVIRAALYKPLAKKDHNQLCIIVKTTERFFVKIAYASVAYIFLLGILFPILFSKNYSFWFTFSLVLIIGVSTAAQYFFGITYQMVLEADQCSYIYSIVQIFTVILYSITAVILVKLGYSIQIVKLSSAVFFVLRPVIIGIYTKKKYKISSDVIVDNELIQQRWDGMAQGIAYFFHTKTDVFVLTVFSSFINVSVYSVYALVISGLTAIINSIDKAIKAVMGNIYANDEIKNFKGTFYSYLSSMHMISSVFFATASITVFQFVKLYTKGVEDAQYIQTFFGILIISAESLYCMRMPYNAVINVAGKFAETKKPAIIEAVLNLSLSCALVHYYGLIGVAIGTWVAMAYRTVSFIIFLHEEILHLSYLDQVKRYITTFLSYFLCVLLGNFFEVSINNYLSWVLYAAIVFVICAIITFVINIILLNKPTRSAIKLLFSSHK